MKIEKFHKQDIGLRQLETALQLFLAGGDLFSVITLAGAAEEILGQLLQQRDSKGKGRFASLFAVFCPGKGGGREGTGSDWQETDLCIHMDLHQEAVFLLGKAVDGYQALTGALTPDMQRFNEEFRSGKE